MLGGVGGVSLLQVVHDAALRHVRYHDHVVDAHHHALLTVALREGGGSALPAAALPLGYPVGGGYGPIARRPVADLFMAGPVRAGGMN